MKIQIRNFLKIENWNFFAFYKDLKNEFRSNLHFKNLIFGKLLKINFIFRFDLASFLFRGFVSACNMVTFVIFVTFVTIFFSNMRVFHWQRCLGRRFGPEIK